MYISLDCRGGERGLRRFKKPKDPVPTLLKHPYSVGKGNVDFSGTIRSIQKVYIPLTHTVEILIQLAKSWYLIK